MSTRDAVLRRIGRTVSGGPELPMATRIVRHAARAHEGGGPVEARYLYEKLPRSTHDAVTRLCLGAIAESEGWQRLGILLSGLAEHETDAAWGCRRARARELGLDIDWGTAKTRTSLGSCYNLMLMRIEVDCIAKIDDASYGEYYLFESPAAADYARAEVVGRRARLHLTGPDLTVLRFADWEHRYTTFVSGPTPMARTDLARAVSFPDTALGEDTGFPNDRVHARARIYLASRFGFVQQRGTTFGHTWDISNTEVLATSTISHWGPPHEMEMPTS